MKKKNTISVSREMDTFHFPGVCGFFFWHPSPILKRGACAGSVFFLEAAFSFPIYYLSARRFFYVLLILRQFFLPFLKEQKRRCFFFSRVIMTNVEMQSELFSTCAESRISPFETSYLYRRLHYDFFII